MDSFIKTPITATGNIKVAAEMKITRKELKLILPQMLVLQNYEMARST